ncbi:MAG: 3-dehydroquinate dehydratase [Pseudonocardiales bacterium]|jgi:3-dehydroquinate dehydratase-2|nr:3-dehydroquinate dehydratase [Pseudonocardiales bacterium]
MDARRVLVLNGPNLGRLGTREPEIYGSTTYPELAALCVRAGAELGLAVEVHQSDAEAELIGWLHRAADEQLPVVLNPAGLSHTSVVLRDAVAARTAPLVEVHISNVAAREEFRRHSYVSAVASGVIAGLGIEGYVLALSWLSSTLAEYPAPSTGTQPGPGVATTPAPGQ